MPLYKIDIERLYHNHNYDKSTQTIDITSRLIITKIILSFNIFNKNNIGLPSIIFVGYGIVEHIFNSPSYIMSSYHTVDNNSDIELIGSLLSHNVYSTTLLNEFEYFICRSEKDIQILKRQDKIFKILNHERKRGVNPGWESK